MAKICWLHPCRLFGEFIEEIRHWDGAEEEEAFITMLASYSQERFLVHHL